MRAKITSYVLVPMGTYPGHYGNNNLISSIIELRHLGCLCTMYMYMYVCVHNYPAALRISCKTLGVPSGLVWVKNN